MFQTVVMKMKQESEEERNKSYQATSRVLAVQGGPGRPRKITPAFLKTIDEIYGEDPTLSMVHVSKMMKVDERTIANAIKKLGMHLLNTYLSLASFRTQKIRCMP